MARKLFGHPENLPGPTGETNQLYLRGRGVFVCISPWNFPLAIFTGQVAAGLASGNAVISKPADQTTLIGYAAVKLLHEAGVPEAVLQFVPAKGSMIGNTLLTKAEVSGVCFTGSTETAWTINRTLAARNAPIAALIAETGGQNAMIADSSALRVLFLQEDIADATLDMLLGAAHELKLGDPFDYATDVGPVIDEEARQALEAHKARMRTEARELLDLPLGPEHAHGTYVSPAIYEIASISMLKREVFGPILHVVRFSADRLGAVCEAINATGYGLTLGLPSRIKATAEFVAERVKVGNMYVNRNQIGAVVGVQPFGGEGLSGTGPKAGGPHYLAGFALERVRTTDLTASGGNASLLAASSDDA
jgi:RHH-type proline utilization regulon transcriptional repressor/proline dehydrogenase/delta 1-pyrroline-5-carboxylate dehydrogenase